MRTLGVVVAGLFFSLSQLPAQSPGGNTLSVGTPVRVGVPLREGPRAVKMRKYQGTVVRHTPAALTISIERPLCPMICDSETMELALATDSVAYVEIPVGRSHWRGAFRGLLVGSVLGLLVYQGAGIDCDETGRGTDCLSDGSRPSQAAYLGEGASIGGLVGAVIGWMTGVVSWERVDFHAAPTTESRGMALAVTIRP